MAKVSKSGDLVIDQFFMLLFQSPDFQKMILEETQGTAMQNMASIGTIKELKVSLPLLAEQHEIVRRIEALFALAERLEARWQTAQRRVAQLTPSLLAIAFRGELVEQDPNDEPAAVLLERIREKRAVQPENIKRIRKSQEYRETKMTEESVKETIRMLPNDKFSYDELREKLPGDYEQLKEILFALLGEDNPTITQTFDQSEKAMRFVRRSK